LICFNVYLEDPSQFESYLARLHNTAADRPLIMTEIGLDSLRNGEETQAEALDWQVRKAFASGCAGVFVFAWTDEWYRGGHDIEDWDFGLTRRDRTPKPALDSVRRAFADVPFPQDIHWPRISVVVCTYNGARTIRDCFEALTRLDYPNFEVIVVDDGSKDATAVIASEYDFRLISTENRGLSNARNTGIELATGEIVAYIDDDAYPDPHWLAYLAETFRIGEYDGVGGPNIAPTGDGLIAECVANAPGGPVHVLLSDREAEHIPGCNMAFRKSALEAVGGFDPMFRTAGDDVDLCWRFRDHGMTIGFSPSAMDWHHRRNSVRAYWKQQVGYGKAEALLEKKWPERYKWAGHLSWSGRLYGKGLTQALSWGRRRVYQGSGGSALFQSLYQPSPGTISSLTLMPEWYLVMLALACISLLGLMWQPLLLTVPLFIVALAATISQAVVSAAGASFSSEPLSGVSRFWMRALTGVLHFLQPLARLTGRISHGLTPWRRYGATHFAFPRPRTAAIWAEHWRTPGQWLWSFQKVTRACGATVQWGGDYDRWDLQVRNGMLGATRVRVTIEEHSGGSQLVRIRWWPKLVAMHVALIVIFATLATAAALDGAWAVSAILGVVSVLLALRAFQESGAAAATILRVISDPRLGGSDGSG
jgi:glycosyltransferase involved in cell wall biosynthesis